MNVRHVCCSIIPLCSHIIKIFSSLAKTAQYDFHRYFRLSSEKQEIPLEEWLYHQYILQTLHNTETCSCVDTSVLHHQLKQCILRYYTLLRCSNVPFHRNFDYLVLYIWRCVFYYLIELEIVLSKWYCSISSCLDTWRKLPWNYTCLCYAPELQYFDDHKESILRLSPLQCVCFWQYPLCGETKELK